MEFHILRQSSHLKTSDQVFQRAYVSGLDSAESVLASMIDEINEYWEETEVDRVVVESTNHPENQYDVFVIHGRDNEIKETVARFLEDCILTRLYYTSNRARDGLLLRSLRIMRTRHSL